MNDLQINTIRLQSGATILISDEMLSSFPSRISCIAKSDRASTFTIRYELKLHFINISLLNIFCFLCGAKSFITKMSMWYLFI